MPTGNFIFTSTGSTISQEQIERAFVNLLLHSPQFKLIVEQIYQAGETVKIYINDGNDVAINAYGEGETDTYAATFDGDAEGDTNSSWIMISDQFLQTQNYYTDYSNGIHSEHSLERVLAHELVHSWQDALNIAPDEEFAAQTENLIM